MAPTGVDFLRFPSVPPDEGVRGIGASEGPREAIVESGVKDKETGVFEDESLLGEVDESSSGSGVTIKIFPPVSVLSSHQ